MSDWTSGESVVQETCCCGALIVPRARYEDTATKRLREFRDAHAPCRAAWARKTNPSENHEANYLYSMTVNPRRNVDRALKVLRGETLGATAEQFLETAAEDLHAVAEWWDEREYGPTEPSSEPASDSTGAKPRDP